MWVEDRFSECIINFLIGNGLIHNHRLLFTIRHCLIWQHRYLRLVKLLLAYFLLHLEPLQKLYGAPSVTN